MRDNLVNPVKLKWFTSKLKKIVVSDDAMGMTLFGIIFLGTIGLTVRAIYGLFARKEERKKAFFQVLVFPIAGFVLLIIVVLLFPTKDHIERMAELKAQRATEAEAQAQVRAQAEAEAKAAEIEACRQDLQCWANKYSESASVQCQRQLERLSKYDFRWTNRWTETRFSRISWENQNQGIITYIGDKAQFQNVFGAWQNVIYSCTYDPVKDSAIDATVTPGRL